MSENDSDVRLSRRDLLAAAGGGLAIAAGLMLNPRLALATPAEVDTLLKEKLNGATPKDGKINLDVPEIAENGATVQFTITVDSPMTDKDHVKEIHVFTEGNPTPMVATYFLTPKNGKAVVSSRMRLAQTQKVRALAVMSDGSAYVAQKEVKVTTGGCGG